MSTNDQQSSSAASIIRFPHNTPRLYMKPRASKEQQLLLATVLDNMSQGVLLFDSESRLVFCNQRYIEMYVLSSDLVQPGCTLSSLLNHRIAVGTFSGNPEEYIERLLADIAEGKPTSALSKSGNGRVFSIVNKPLASGGWLATHEDITERNRAQEQIAHMARHDALTGLPNRVMLRERLEHELIPSP